MDIDIQKTVDEILGKNPEFTGQINIEIHVKDGKVKDVYVTNRSKVNANG